MKLIVTIPCFNEEENLAAVIKEIPRQISGIDSVEVVVISDGSTDKTVEIAKNSGADHVVDRKINKGLATTFKQGLEKALEAGADIIVNTDGDNHYDQSKIPELIEPIVKGLADVVVGGRMIEKLEHMKKANKYGNMMGSRLVCWLAGLPPLDVSTGFRAYTRESALKLNVLSNHTYTHETFFQSADQNLRILEVPILARAVKRPSRLIKSIRNHIKKSLIVIARTMILYKPLKVFGIAGVIIFIIGLIPAIRFLYFYFAGGGTGHIQSLVLGSALMTIGFQVGLLGLVASAVGWNRKLIEEVNYRIKKTQYSNKENK